MVSRLAAAGFDIVSMTREAPGASDTDVLARAARENRVLLTFDNDFGELAFLRRMPVPAGVVLLRMTLRSPEYVAERLLRLLQSAIPVPGHFTVLSGTRTRSLPLRPAR